MGEILNNFPSHEDYIDEGYVTRDWGSDYNDLMLKFYYSPIQSTTSVFTWHRKNRIGAESEFLVYVGPDNDGDTKQKIHLMIKGTPIKKDGIIFKRNPDVDFSFSILNDWAKDAPTDIRMKAQNKLRELFDYQLRVPDLTKVRKLSLGSKVKGDVIGSTIEAGANYKIETEEKMKGKNSNRD